MDSDVLAKGNLVLRDIRPGDINYILATWSKGVLSEPPFKWMKPAVWKKQHDRMEQLLAISQVVLAVNPTDEDHIIGYAIADQTGKVVHWAYVKRLFRGRGIGKQLIAAVAQGFEKEPVFYSHMAPIARAKAETWQVVYDPFLAWI